MQGKVREHVCGQIFVFQVPELSNLDRIKQFRIKSMTNWIDQTQDFLNAGQSSTEPTSPTLIRVFLLPPPAFFLTLLYMGAGRCC